MESAITREQRLKNWKRAWKIRLIDGMNPTWLDLYRYIYTEGVGAARPFPTVGPCLRRGDEGGGRGDEGWEAGGLPVVPLL